MERDKKKFLAKYNKTDEDFRKSGCRWEELLAIADNYQETLRDLEPVAKYFVERIKELKPQVHSVWYRLKDVEHLVEKILRKKMKDPSRMITLENYKSEITDLVGIRILHLFKEDWAKINDFIQGHWETIGEPVAYVREGDDGHYIKIFQEKGCRIRKDKPYRSVHYLVKTQPSKEVCTAEIQARTLFEEGWSAIDHEMVYPINQNEMLQRYLSILNRLAGAADEMGSFLKFLRDELELKDREVERQKKLVLQLRQEIDDLKRTAPEAATRIEGKLENLLDDQDNLVISPNLFIPIIKSWENILGGRMDPSDQQDKIVSPIATLELTFNHPPDLSEVKNEGTDKPSENK